MSRITTSGRSLWFLSNGLPSVLGFSHTSILHDLRREPIPGEQFHGRRPPKCAAVLCGQLLVKG